MDAKRMTDAFVTDNDARFFASTRSVAKPQGFKKRVRPEDSSKQSACDQ